jgi:hypothetical protein
LLLLLGIASSWLRAEDRSKKKIENSVINEIPDLAQTDPA